VVIRLGSFEGGREVLSEERKSFSDLNPATGEVLAEVEEATKEDVDRVVKIAQGGFKRWSKIPVAQRSALIHRLADYLESRSEELAEMETRDTGKPLTLSKSLDIPRSIFNFRFFADYAKTLGTEAFQSDDQAINYALRRPVGVAGLISPWNLPLLLLTWKVAPAIAAGNSCVIKPAELTPLTAYELARAAQEVGLPEGVINVVNGFGPQSAGEFLVAHPNVDLISLTGETSTGKAVMASAASTLKRVSFELGGKNPLIVFADCDFDEMIETTRSQRA
jgi:aminomuconate-semialdehyde/2-hydroxymuconate-6-semialdehyde dehydrogenase